ncbi:MAG: hypothetical protein F6K45_12810 [Kamptonema sp. SIO1D9]|nr:hypothetical protein [Kamptonema sp. SIO1D9]
MSIFSFLQKKSSKRTRAKGFQSPKTHPKQQIETFILEPILTPSGILDGTDDTPDPVALSVPEVDIDEIDRKSWVSSPVL